METPEQLKTYLLEEIKKTRPDLLTEFESIWMAVSMCVKTKVGIDGFLEGYGEKD